MAGHSTEVANPVEGVRERKKRLMRQRLSDTATRMFLERGFDAVTVSQVAVACGVSEKTVFNYFPSKEALILDRLEAAVEAIHHALSDSANPPVATFVWMLEGQTRSLTTTLMGGDGEAADQVRRYGDLLRSTQSLRAYQSDMVDRFAATAAAALAARAGLAPEDPEPQMAARSLLNLWRVQGDSLNRHLTEGLAPQRIRDTVIADVRRAARLLENGLGAWDSPR